MSTRFSWYCRSCRDEGEAAHKDKRVTLAVIDRMREIHDRYNPQCQAGQDIRVRQVFQYDLTSNA